MANRRSRSQNRPMNPAEGKGVDLYKPLPPKYSKEGFESEKKKIVVRTFSHDRALSPGVHNDLPKNLAIDRGNMSTFGTAFKLIEASRRRYLLNDDGSRHVEATPNPVRALPDSSILHSQLLRINNAEKKSSDAKSSVENSLFLAAAATPEKAEWPIKRATTPSFMPAVKKPNANTPNKQSAKPSTTPLMSNVKLVRATTPNKSLGSTNFRSSNRSSQMQSRAKQSNDLENFHNEVKMHWKCVATKLGLISQLMEDVMDRHEDIKVSTANNMARMRRMKIPKKRLDGN